MSDLFWMGILFFCFLAWSSLPSDQRYVVAGLFLAILALLELRRIVLNWIDRK
jgi:hypothetical protein